MSRKARALVGLFLVTWAASASAERLPLKNYTTADGLPHNEINRIVRDSRGFLWVCTPDGLTRYDGYGFTTYTTEQGLPNRGIEDLLEARDGRYWIATAAGLVRFDPAAAQPFAVVPVRDGDSATTLVTMLLEDRGGVVWAGTTRGLYRLDEAAGAAELRPVDIGIPHANRDQANVLSGAAARDGSIWIGTPSGLYRRWPDGHAARYTRTDGLPDDFIHDVVEDRRGRLWVATRYEGLFELAAGTGREAPTVRRSYSVAQGLPTRWIFTIFEGAAGQLWLGTNAGLVRFSPDARAPDDVFHAYSTSHGFTSKEITAISEDTGGNLWLGTNTGGVMRLALSGFTTYSETDGVAAANAIFEDRAGTLCVRGADAVVQATRFGCFDGRRFVWFTPPGLGPYLGWVSEQVTLQTAIGEWWLASGNGVYRFAATARFSDLQHARPLASYTVRDGLAAPQVFRLFEDSRGDVWISTISSETNGLAIWERATARVRSLGGVPGLPSLTQELPRSFGEDARGSVWIGFGGGLARYSGDHVRFFTAADGLPPGAIMSIHADDAGRLWLASSRSGIVRVDDPSSDRARFVAYGTAQGLSSSRTEVVTSDRYGRIYVATGRGLDRLDPATGRIAHFTSADGLAPGIVRAAYRDRRGTLWFGMTGGLSRFTPGPQLHHAPPPILVSRLLVAGSPHPVPAIGAHAVTLPDLASAQNHLQIEFLGLDFSSGEPLRYQYKLEGADPDWSAPGAAMSVNYANLAAGRYRFLVRGVAADGTTSSDPATVAFVVLRPMWQRWWFVTLVAAAAGAAAYAAYRARMAQMLRVASVRTRIATDLHDDIGANLTRIAILSEVARQQLTGPAASPDGPLASIAGISRESIASLSDIVWAVNPQHDHLDDLVRRMRRHAEELFTTRGVVVNFHAPDEHDLALGAAVRRGAFLIFKESVSNVARHAGCSSVSIDVAVHGRALVIEVADDGRGFDPRAAAHDGEGLSSMTRRAERLGGALEVTAAPGVGTRVQATIPTHPPGNLPR